MKLILVTYFLVSVILGIGFIYFANSIGHSKAEKASSKKEQIVHKSLSNAKK